MKRWISTVVASLFFSLSLQAARVSSEDVSLAVKGWLNINSAPLNVQLNQTIQKIQVYNDTKQEPLFYVSTLESGGFVITSADDSLQPVISFSGSGTFDPSAGNPLWSLINNDMKGRLRYIRKLQSKRALPGGLSAAEAAVFAKVGQAESRWAELIAASKADAMDAKTGLSSISDVRVGPLVQTQWNQTTVSGQNTYNYYTPNNYPCGCVATAMSQVMFYHQYPTAAIGQQANSIEVDGYVQTAYTRGGDGSGGAYNWGSMPLRPADGTLTTAQRQAIGSLCSDAGISCHMSYSGGGSGALENDASDGFKNFFGYSSARYYMTYGYNVSSAFSQNLLNSNLDAGFPVMVGITGNGGHEIVCDGYGYNASTMYHHMNMGWGGSEDMWYALPDIGAGFSFDIIDGFGYNIYPDGSGEIISGRVLDSLGLPVAGVTVSAGSYSDTTDANGIYGLAKVPAGSYTITATKSGYMISSVNETISASSDYVNWSGSQRTSACGNKWGVDLIMQLDGTDPKPDLAPFQPAGWDSKIVVSTVAGTITSADQFTTDDTLYVDFSCVNRGNAAAGAHKYGLYLDNNLVASADLASLGVAEWDEVLDHNLGSLSVGSHQLKIVADYENSVDELSELNNEYTRTIMVQAPAVDDSYEPNDVMGSAYVGVPEGTWLSDYEGLGVQSNDDWYQITVSDGATQIHIECMFSHAAGDIDIALYNASGVFLDDSYSVTDREEINYSITEGGIYYILVYYADAGNTYDLLWNDDILDIDADITHIEINGPASVYGERSASYTCMAHYDDGRSADITGQCLWSVDAPAYASISQDGVLTAADVDQNRTVVVQAEYTHLQGDFSDTKSIEITYETEPEGPAESAIIVGPTAVHGGTQAQLIFMGVYSNGTFSISSGVTWISPNPSVATISSDGTLTTYAVATDTEVTILAHYFNGTQRVQDIHVVTVTAEPPEPSNPLLITGAGSVLEGTQSTYLAVWRSDGQPDLDVTAQTVWSVTGPAGTTVTGGVLTAGEVEADTLCTLSALYDGNTAELQVLIQNEVILPDISHIEISGPSEVQEQSSAAYTCMVHYSDGTSADVTGQCVWSVDNPAYAAISAGGVLTAADVDRNRPVVVNADYIHPQGAFSDTLSVQIIYVIEPVGAVQAITIEGPVEVHGGTQAQLICMGTYANGTFPIEVGVTWMSHNIFIAPVSSSGRLTTSVVTTDADVTIIARYFNGTQLLQDSHVVTVTVEPPDAYGQWVVTESVPANMSGYSDTPAGDGIPNLLKYACGLPAMTPATTADLMSIVNDGPDNFAVIYYKSKTAEGVILEPIWATTPAGPWITTGLTSALEADGSVRQQWKASMPAVDKGFIKLRATAD